MATEPDTKANPLAALDGDATLVVARALTLQPLQGSLHRADAVVPTLLSARYRLRSGPVFGNLLAAFAEDLARLVADAGEETRGDLLPAVEPSSLWAEFIARGEWLVPRQWRTDDWVGALLGEIADALGSHERLLLLCEIEGDPGSVPEWSAARDALESLPRNVTIVVSDAPQGYRVPEIEAPQDAGEHEEVFTFVEAALSGDQAADVDRLGVAPLADGLARLLMLPQTRPLTVGVQAPWGWGKSSFVGFVRDALIRHAPSNAERAADTFELESLDRRLAAGPTGRERVPDAEIAGLYRELTEERAALMSAFERRAHRDVVCIQFNAWRYEGSEQVWAGLARTITASLEGTLSRPARLRSRLAYAIRRRKLEFWLGFVTPVVLAVLLAGLAILLGVADAGDELSGWTGVFAGVIAPVAAVVLIAWRFLRVIQPVSVQVAGYVQGPDYAAHMGYQNEVIDDLKFLHGRVKGEPRIVVFVDDLDRCSDESIMETLQAINLVLGASDFFVVLAIDPDMIHRAIARQRGLADDDEAAETFAQNYLRKIIQLPLVLPGRTADQRFGFVSQLFSPAARRAFELAEAGDEGTPPEPAGEQPPAPGRVQRPFDFDLAAVVPPQVRILREVQDTKEELEALRATQELLDDNPRELKRLVNVHRLVKILLLRQDAPPTVEQQRKLVAWLVFCARSPGEIDGVLDRAAAEPDEDCVTTVGGYRLAARDLAPDGTLARAARISQLVRDRPAATLRPSEAESDPAAPRAASPS